MTGDDFIQDLVRRLARVRQLFVIDQPILTTLLIRLVQALDYARADLGREVLHRACRDAGLLQSEGPAKEMLDQILEGFEGNPFEEYDDRLDDDLENWKD